jgi:hypothetical protein
MDQCFIYVVIFKIKKQPQKFELMVFSKLWHLPNEIQLFLPDFDLGSYLGIEGTPPPRKGFTVHPNVSPITRVICKVTLSSLCLSPSIVSFGGIHKVRKFY